MQVFVLLFSLFHFAFPYHVVSDETILRALFGNVTEMKDMFLPHLKDVSSREESSLEEENDLPNIKGYFRDMSVDCSDQDEDVNLTIYNHDVTEFNTISKLLDDMDLAQHESPIISRRWATWNDPEDDKNIELEKKQMLLKLMLTMVIHIRFKVDMAIRQRKLGRSSKGYRLGYLFSRLRRNKFYMARVLNTMIRQDWERHHLKFNYARIVDNHHDMILRWYEKMMRLDVESRDLIDLVLEVVWEVNPSTTTSSDD